MLERARPTASATFVATLKPKVYADRIVHRFGLAPYFSGVYGSELEGKYDDRPTSSRICLETERIHAGTR